MKPILARAYFDAWNVSYENGDYVGVRIKLHNAMSALCETMGWETDELWHMMDKINREHCDEKRAERIRNDGAAEAKKKAEAVISVWLNKDAHIALERMLSKDDE